MIVTHSPLEKLPEDNASVRFKVKSVWLIGNYVASDKIFIITPENFWYYHEVSTWKLLNEF